MQLTAQSHSIQIFTLKKKESGFLVISTQGTSWK